MASHGEEKELRTTDPVAATNATNSSEPVATEPLQYVVSESESSISEREKDPEKSVRRTTTARTTSTAGTSALSSQGDETKSADQTSTKKAWYKRLNPLKGKHKPPVPKERVVSREYGAGFLSRLTFQWMSPMMRVCDQHLTARKQNADCYASHRSDIKGHSNSTTSGLLTLTGVPKYCHQSSPLPFRNVLRGETNIHYYGPCTRRSRSNSG